MDIAPDEKLILKVLAGSKAYGLDDEHSDTDTHSIVVVPTRRLVSLNPNMNNADAVPGEDHVTWEIGKFIKLALGCNPTVLETFVAPVLETSSHGNWLRPMFPQFLQKTRIFNAFRGYADGQRHLIAKKGSELDPRRCRKAAIAYLRTLDQGIELLRTGTYDVRISDGDFKDYLLAIKNGSEPFYGSRFDFESELKELQIQAAYDNSTLRDYGERNVTEINDYLVQLRWDFW